MEVEVVGNLEENFFWHFQGHLRSTHKQKRGREGKRERQRKYENCMPFGNRVRNNWCL